MLVVFDGTAIIWQIKELKLDEHGRYEKAEVEKNLHQLAGARRQLFDLKTKIELENPRIGGILCNARGENYMRLFKFVTSSHAVANMARGSLKFTPIDELNDPTELTPIMNRAAVRDSLKFLRTQGLTDSQYDWLVRQDALLDLLAPQEKVLDVPTTLAEANRMLSISTYDNLDYMERKLFATIESIRNEVGILSLSERYDSLPMWAHYADQARGLVVVFKNLDCFFKGDQTGSLNVTKPVEYAEEFIGMTFDPSTQDRLFFSKLDCVHSYKTLPGRGWSSAKAGREVPSLLRS